MRADARKNYEHLLTVAREVVTEQGAEASLRDIARRADELEESAPPAEALTSWLREAVAVAHEYRGAIDSMVAAIADTESALHASCQTMRAAGTRLLVRAQEQGMARAGLDGTDLFGLLGAARVAPGSTSTRATRRSPLRRNRRRHPDQG
jgi:hypothetical protein